MAKKEKKYRITTKTFEKNLSSFNIGDHVSVKCSYESFEGIVVFKNNYFISIKVNQGGYVRCVDAHSLITKRVVIIKSII